MEQIFAADEREAWAVQLQRPFELASPFSGAGFALLLAVYDPSVTDDEQARLSERFVAEGCRYAVCTGDRCSSWDDAIDTAYLASEPDFQPSDATFVMTTWHEEEPLGDVAEFFMRSARFDGFEPRRFLAVCVGGDEACFARLRDAVRTQLRLTSEPRR
ncbi:MAG: hypothetical protein AAF682_14745 [Planctomycetota bacterium]